MDSPQKNGNLGLNIKAELANAIGGEMQKAKKKKKKKKAKKKVDGSGMPVEESRILEEKDQIEQ